jgi:hypothetical protein
VGASSSKNHALQKLWKERERDQQRKRLRREAATANVQNTWLHTTSRLAYRRAVNQDQVFTIALDTAIGRLAGSRWGARNVGAEVNPGAGPGRIAYVTTRLRIAIIADGTSRLCKGCATRAVDADGCVKTGAW